ncbi:S1C family serine protease [Natronoglycomyces albus]|uniref:Trypsin-like peptidase domain-containing protein n=1 Tax=Natronoglycomyces albus TaxID=2811108 RepID=A0A895XHL9_9ACTN|nr:trypsin-like peptidase domain-containing protein [Natronoglycomyces albus]QSB04427.1 trypsin-like peptidase domain-containing protein [Natronoglycomyces albus]
MMNNGMDNQPPQPHPGGPTGENSPENPPENPQPPNENIAANPVVPSSTHGAPASGPVPPVPPGNVQPGPMATANVPPGVAPPAGPPAATKPSGWKLLAGALVIALLAGGVGGAIGYFMADRTEVVASPSMTVSDDTIAAVAADVSPSVVAIVSGSGEGSGVIYSDEGYIITNNHVVAGADSVTVRFSDGRTDEAVVVGADPSQDLAVIQVENTSDLQPIRIGDSSGIQVGDLVLAIGSPLGLEGTVTSGIVSALDRAISVGGDAPQGPAGATTLEGLIQTDAAINMGNSGGALVNGNGELVGVNTAIASTEHGSIGLGFAIPSETAADVASQIIETGSVEQPYMGVAVADVEDGAMVLRVDPEGPAAEAGLEPGDIIVAIDGEDILRGSDVRTYVSGTEPGQSVEVTYVRDGDTGTLRIDIAAQQAGN